MSRVVEYEATKEQVIEFRADCDKVMDSFDDRGRPGPETKEMIRQLRAKWDPARKTRGRQMSGVGLYGDLYEAILRLPRLSEPTKWHDALYLACSTAPFIDDGE